MNKIIFISNNLMDIKNTKKFAQDNNYALEYYSQNQWNKKHLTVIKDNNITHLDPNNSSPLNNIFQRSSLVDIKHNTIIKALLVSRGNVTKASKVLNIGRSTIYKILITLNITPQSIRNSLKDQEKQHTLKVAS